ncbi:MAG: hypothetical protein HRU29_04495 [Rhizobiales bacterium]|nr:hypothetical protein [Hyphomicrobiales bacterium]NRB13642.1 hypothetical protein [Hyphomicrobiales bacterium]
MNFIKTENIAIWITLLAIAFALSAMGLGIMSLFGPVPEAAQITPYLGGRSFGLGLVFAFAVLLKSPATYIAAFIAGAAREIGDIFGELTNTTPSMGTMTAEAGFAIVCLLAAYLAYKARNTSQ